MHEILIMTPGPTYVSERVRQALARPITNPDLDPDFYEFYKETARQLQKLLATKNDVLILNGEGILGLEAACASLIEPGDRVLCLENGIFGRGFGDFVKMYGGEAVYFTRDYRQPISPEELQEFLEQDSDFKFATVVHCETPSGLVNPVRELCPVLKKFGILTVVDSVSAIGGEPLLVDQWKIDIALGGSQKCLSAPPGLTFLSISADAWKAVLNRKKPIAAFYCNLALWKKWYEEKWFPYTQPISDIYGLREAVDLLLQDESRLERHRVLGEAVRGALLAAGLKLYPVEGFANTVSAVQVPEGVKVETILEAMLKKHRIMLAGAFDVLAGKVFRIGHMGENCREDKLYLTMKALDQVLRELGVSLNASLPLEFIARAGK